MSAPTPWAYEKFERAGLFGFRVVAADGGIVCEAYPQPTPVHVSEDVAAFIVRAGNAHENLLEALCMVADIADGSTTANSLPNIARVARSAIANARAT